MFFFENSLQSPFEPNMFFLRKITLAKITPHTRGQVRETKKKTSMIKGAQTKLRGIKSPKNKKDMNIP